MAIISEFRFPALSETPRYTADVVRVEWEYDRDTYRRLDNVQETDVRAQRCVVSWEGVLVAENTDAEGLHAAALYEKIRSQRAAGNAVELEPDVDARDSSNNKIAFEIITAGDPPEAFRTEQSSEQLRRSLDVYSRSWFDPSSATVSAINDLSTIAPLQ